MDYDVLVIGSGIGGMESAIKLGDMGYKVLVVEKEASVGGKMILLSKVFPTLDCASCISTPKMAATIHHPNITAYDVQRGRGHRARRGRPLPRPDPAQGPLRRRGRLHRLPAVRDGLHGRGARPVQRRPRPAPCRLHRVPAGGAQEGRHRPGRQLALHRSPARPASRPTATSPSSAAASTRRPSSSSSRRRRLWARWAGPATPPARRDCTRGELEGTLPIRRLKRFADDWHHEHSTAPASRSRRPTARASPSSAPALRASPPPGSWPAGATASGSSRRPPSRAASCASPSRPIDCRRRSSRKDIANVTDIGVEIVTNHPCPRPRGAPRRGLRRGARRDRHAPLDEPGRPRRGRAGCHRRRRVPARRPPRRAADLAGKPSSSSAAATSRWTLPAPRAAWAQRRHGRLPARARGDARPPRRGRRRREGGRAVRPSSPPRSRSSQTTAGPSAACAARGWPSARLTPPDAAGPSRSPAASTSSTASVVVAAIGMAADTRRVHRPASRPTGTAPSRPTRSRCRRVPRPLRGRRRGHGARGHHPGRRPRPARRVHDRPLAHRRPAVRLRRPAGRSSTSSRSSPGRAPTRSARPTPAQRRTRPRPHDFAEIEPPMTEEEALAGAGGCLDCAVCSECQECVKACPVRLHRPPRPGRGARGRGRGGRRLDRPQALRRRPQARVRLRRFKNVITGMQMDRLLAPTRPFNTILRPGDGKVPERIAYVLCTGSRDETGGQPALLEVLLHVLRSSRTS